MSISGKRVLVINADGRFLQFLPLQRAIANFYEDDDRFGEKFIPLVSEVYKVRTVGGVFTMPTAIMLAYKADVDRNGESNPLPSSRDVKIYHNFRCAYCGKEFREKDLTIDHVIPSSRGGDDSWENLVPACAPCNHKKADRTPREAGMPLKFKPETPSAKMFYPMAAIRPEWEPILDRVYY